MRLRIYTVISKSLRLLRCNKVIFVSLFALRYTILDDGIAFWYCISHYSHIYGRNVFAIAKLTALVIVFV